MSRELSPLEREQADRIATQAAALINSRGRHDDRDGIYERDEFRASINYGANGCMVRVTHRGREVMWARWAEQDSPGRAYVEPGQWQAAFLSLPTAHS